MSGSSILEKALAIRSKGFPPRVTAVISIVAMAAVIWLSIVAIRSLDIGWADLNKTAAVLCLLLGFTILPLNASEYRLSSRLAGSPVAWQPAFRTTIIATAANILPIPAGAFVRVQGLRSSGADTTSSLAGTGFIAATWLAVSAFAAASALLIRGATVAGLGFSLICVLASVGAVLASRKCPGHSASTTFRVVALEIIYGLTGAARFWLALQVINVPASASDAIVIASGSPVASAAGIIPGAIGIFEGLAAAAAKLVGLPEAAGLLAAALLRVMGLATSAGALLWLGLERIRRSRIGNSEASRNGEA